MQRTLLAITTFLFAILTGIALWKHGYSGVLGHQFQNFAGGQVFADLVIALSLATLWMWHDAKATGRSIWIWIFITLIFGSFGPLLYLLTRKTNATKQAQAETSSRN
jgi:hypothetical protein